MKSYRLGVHSFWNPAAEVPGAAFMKGQGSSRRVRAGLREETICWKNHGVCGQAATADPALLCARWRGGWYRICWGVCPTALCSLGKSPRSAFSSYKNLPWPHYPGTQARWCWSTVSTTHGPSTAQPHVMLLFTVQPGTPSPTHPRTTPGSTATPSESRTELWCHHAPLSSPVWHTPSLRWMSLNTCVLLQTLSLAISSVPGMGPGTIRMDTCLLNESMSVCTTWAGQDSASITGHPLKPHCTIDTWGNEKLLRKPGRSSWKEQKCKKERNNISFCL